MHPASDEEPLVQELLDDRLSPEDRRTLWTSLVVEAVLEHETPLRATRGTRRRRLSVVHPEEVVVDILRRHAPPAA